MAGPFADLDLPPPDPKKGDPNEALRRDIKRHWRPELREPEPRRRSLYDLAPRTYEWPI